MKASQKFSTLTETVDYSTAQTLWNLTVDKSYTERLNTLGYYIDSLDEDDRNKLLTDIEDEVIQEEKRIASFESALAGDTWDDQPQYSVPLNVLEHFIRHPSSKWDIAIACNENITPEMLTLILEKNNSIVTIGQVLQHPKLTSDMIAKIYSNSDRSVYVLSYMAVNPKTPQNILEELSRHSSIMVRQQVIKNPNTPLGVRTGMSDKLRYDKNRVEL